MTRIRINGAEEEVTAMTVSELLAPRVVQSHNGLELRTEPLGLHVNYNLLPLCASESCAFDVGTRQGSG